MLCITTDLDSYAFIRFDSATHLGSVLIYIKESLTIITKKFGLPLSFYKKKPELN